MGNMHKLSYPQMQIVITMIKEINLETIHNAYLVHLATNPVLVTSCVNLF